MIYVRIELWPNGDRTQARMLQEMKITNVGGDEMLGLYDAAVSHSTTFRGDGFADPRDPQPHETWRSATSIRHRRRNSPTHLVFAALHKMGIR